MSPRPRRGTRMRTNVAAIHQDWLALTTPTLPFLSVPVLEAAFPEGLKRVPPGLRAETIGRWDGDDFDEGAAVLADRMPWVEWLLSDFLEHGDRVMKGDRFTVMGPEQDTTFAASFAVLESPAEPATSPARLLVHVLPTGAGPDGRPGDTWSATWTQRMALLCRSRECPIGLITDGDFLRVIWAPVKTSTGYATWQASLFATERPHLDSFWTIFHARQFFATRPEDQPEALLKRSEAAEDEVTGTLGRQVREAVELVVASLDRANRDPETPEFLHDVEPAKVYEAAVTVLMRLVFLLAAEENEMLPTDNRLYAAQYAITTLRGALERDARLGRERLEQRAAAWHRILATTRAVYGGINHELLRIPPYGGSLFDPDRYPFLEGRTSGDATPWWEEPGRPPVVDDLTILAVMRALQVLQLSASDTRTLSYRHIEVEQIGHVYEGLLDHSATTKPTTFLGLVGKPASQEEAALADLEAKSLIGRAALVTLLKGLTGMSAKKLGEALDASPDPRRLVSLRIACGGDQSLTERVTPFLGVLRDDLRGYPLVFPAGAIFVTQTGSRRDTGTAYTTRALAEEIVEHALEPLCYAPRSSADRARGDPRPSAEILELKVCDPAVGSGAILVAACRYLADALIEAWVQEGTLDAAALASAGDNPARLDHQVRAMRHVAERCCYGVDRNPMAVEMAKMSFWIATMAEDRPFSYLDHNIRAGDSLLCVTSLDQLTALHLDPAFGRMRQTGLPGIDPAVAWAAIGPLVDEAVDLRLDIEASPSDTARDTARKAILGQRAADRVAAARVIADLLIGCALVSAGDANPSRGLDEALRMTARPVAELLLAFGTPIEADALGTLGKAGRSLLDRGTPADAPRREPFHWPLVFPEVFATDRSGFDACVGNPPFVGGQKVARATGDDYRNFLVAWRASGVKGSADLVAYFFLIATRIASTFGLLATNTVAQGDSSEVGLAQIIDAGWTVYRAVSSTKWPGSESLEIAKVWATAREWLGPSELDGRKVRAIDEMLYQTPRSGWRKKRLIENYRQSFQGSNILGDGFKLSPDDAVALIAKDPRNAEVLLPLLGGEDINDSPTQNAPRWVINFFDWSEERARTYPDCYAIVEERVKPQRALDRRAARRDRWWRYAEPAPALYQAIRPLDRCLALSRVSKTVQPVFVRTTQVLSEATVVFAFDDDFNFAVLASEFHRRWAFRYASTLRTDTRYTPSDVFETFPRPPYSEAVDVAGRKLDEFRSNLMIRSGRGLTATYNLFHNATVEGKDIDRLRELHRVLDYAVLEAYGWSTAIPDLAHGFHPVRLQGQRLTFAPEVADEVIDLLLEENKRRYESEVRRGVQRPNRARGSGQSDGTLFSDGDPEDSIADDNDEELE
jgi:hypothetical protein